MDADHVDADVTAIRALLEHWVESTRHGDNDHVLDGHAQDVLVFDVLPPVKYEGAQATGAGARGGRARFSRALGDMTMSTDTMSFDGACTCRFVRYRMSTSPLFVHCCHCRWCQRESGAAFALNAMIEADRVQLLQGEVEVVNTPSNSGKGQKVSRCPTCRIALWSNYAGAGDAVRFVRVTTLDEPDRRPPDIHIFTASKQPWVVLVPDTPAVAEYYKASERWLKASLERRAMLLAEAQQP